MSIILIISILVRVAALAWSILLMRRLRDGRVGFLSLMLLIMTARQVATLMSAPGPEGAWRLEWGAPVFEIPALAVSLMALLAVYGLERLLTARRSTEESLRESEERFRQLAETIHGVVWLMDWNERKVLYISPGYEEIWGRRREGFEDEPFDWLAGIHPDDRERVRDLFTTQVARGGYDTEFRVLRADGSRRWIHDRGFPIKNAAGQVYRVGGLAEDITKRKEAEQALRDSEAKRRSITESSPDYILTIDLMGRIQYLNRADFGLSVEDLTGKSVYDFVSAADRKVMGDCFAHVMATGQVGRYEVVYRTPEGEERIFDTQVGPVMRDGDVIGLTLSSRDVTHRKRAEAERERLAAELRQAQKLEAVGTLASGIAHDFNNLLTAIGGYTELAQNALAPDHPAARSLRMIEKASDQAVSVTRSLLTFARKTSTEKRPVDLTGLIRDSMGFLRRVLPASIEIEQQIPENGAVWIEGDPGLLQQVLMNLAVNARDAMPAGGRLSVSVSGPGNGSPADRSGATPSRSPEAVLIVEDSGSGIPQQEAARIFEPFYTTKPRGKGTGLGLSVVHGIVADHGGKIGVESGGGGRDAVPDSLPPLRATAGPSRRDRGRRGAESGRGTGPRGRGQRACPGHRRASRGVRGLPGGAGE